VSHRGVTVNGKAVNLPSYQVKAGDAIALDREGAQRQLRVQEALTVSRRWTCSPSWVEVDAKKFSRRVQGVAGAQSDLPSDINESLIVELYSK
jgi:small subunit ribosomal protein S4